MISCLCVFFFRCQQVVKHRCSPRCVVPLVRTIRTSVETYTSGHLLHIVSLPQQAVELRCLQRAVEHRFLPFNTCDARVGKISFPVVFLLRILWQRRRTCNLFTSKENASKCHKASHEVYSWLKNQLTMILKVCWNWCHPLKHLLIKCCCKPSFSKPVHFAPLL